MSIRSGDTAAPFTLPCKPGETIDVGALLGKEKIVLLFIPLAFSPVCAQEMCTMRDNWEEWASLNANVFAISVDSPFVTDKFRTDMQIPFPVLSDFNKDVSETYGALHEELAGMKGVSKRSAFVIDESGTVTYAWVSDDPKQLPDFEAIKSAVG